MTRETSEHRRTMPIRVAVPSPKALIASLVLVGAISVGYVATRVPKQPASAASSSVRTEAPILASASVEDVISEDTRLPPPELTDLDEPIALVPAQAAARIPEANPASTRAAALAALWPPGMESRAVASRAKRNRRTSSVSDDHSAYRGSTNEEQLILEAHEQLQLGDPRKALEFLAEHQRRYPNGAMQQSREAVRVVATCNLGRKDEARQLLTKFVAEWPESPFQQRIRGACGWTVR